MIRPSLLAWFLLAAVAVAARPDDSCEGLPVLIDEHFQALQEACTVKGFRAYGGKWRVEGGVLHAPAGPGFKLVADEAPLENGEIGVEVLLPAAGPGNAGLIVKLSEPGVGADRFNGYEVGRGIETPGNETPGNEGVSRPFIETGDPDYRMMLAAIQEGKRRAEETPEADMPGFHGARPEP